VLFSNRVEVRIRDKIKFSVSLASGYAHVFVLLSVVIVTLSQNLRMNFVRLCSIATKLKSK